MWGAQRPDGHTIGTGKSKERLRWAELWLAYVGREGPWLGRGSTQSFLGYYSADLHRKQQCCYPVERNILPLSREHQEVSRGCGVIERKPGLAVEGPALLGRTPGVEHAQRCIP